MAKLFLPVIFLTFFIGELNAESLCRSSLAYKWKKAGPAAEELVVDKIVLEALGADEAQAKAVLVSRLPQEKARVAEACRLEHESSSDCLSTKFAAKASVLNSLRFDARKSLQDAIAADCAAQQGVCVQVVVSDPQCEVRATEVEVEEDKKGGEKKK